MLNFRGMKSQNQTKMKNSGSLNDIFFVNCKKISIFVKAILYRKKDITTLKLFKLK